MNPRILKAVAAGAALFVVGVWTAREAWSARRLPVARPLVVDRAFVDRVDTLQRDETLSHLFGRHRVEGTDLLAFLEAAPAIQPRRLRAGQAFTFRYPVDAGTPDRVTVRLGDDELLVVSRDGAAWRGRSQPILWTVHREHLAGEIRSSLYETVDELIRDSVLPAEQRRRLAWDLADGVFGWVIDFNRDIYAGDDLELLYERVTSQFGDIRYGRVLAVRLESRGELNTAYVMRDDRGRNAYYDHEGQSLRRAFKLSPVAYRYVSSGFSRNRYHPILKRRRPHLGVDYRARHGSPVRATGDGVVTRARRWGGYGLMVSIRHAKGIETRYAHLSKLGPGIRAGRRVEQDQTLGYVGMSGLATAPHVHYEFLQGGRHVNPRMAVRYGTGEPVPAARRAEFDSLRTLYDRLLAHYRDSRSRARAAGVDD